MKKIRLLLVALAVIMLKTSFAGGIMTNTNQSAAWVRMLCRDAVIGIDGVYFNPAGLTQMGEGIFLSVNNQSLVQNRVITSDYTYLNSSEFDGVVNAPLFPSVYAAYNTGKLSISLGFNAIGGGGGATFDKGLPSLEYAQSELVPKFNALNTAVGTPAGVDLSATAYSMDAFFEGTSIYWGMQLGATYQINDMISVFLGGRYVMAKNTYTGHLKDVMIDNPTQGSVRADNFINTTILPTVNGTVDNLNSVIAIPSTLSDALPLIGGLTIAQAQGAGALTAEQAAGITAGTALVGGDPTTLTLQQISDLITGATPTLQGQVSQLQGTATELGGAAVLLADQEADVEQTGTGFTPIVGVNLNFEDKLNIGIKYEMATKIELENATAKDVTTGFDATGAAVTMFPDGEKNRADMPAMLSFGVSYKVMDNFTLTGGTHYYFDKSADYGKKVNDVKVANDKVIDAGLMELGFGAEYAINDKIAFSLGYLNTNTGVNEDFQSDLSYSLSTSTIGLGASYALNENIKINIGGALTSYVEGSKTIQRADPTGLTTTMTDIKETYDKDVMFVGVGVDFKF